MNNKDMLEVRSLVRGLWDGRHPCAKRFISLLNTYDRLVHIARAANSVHDDHSDTQSWLELSDALSYIDLDELPVNDDQD